MTKFMSPIRKDVPVEEVEPAMARFAREQVLRMENATAEENAKRFEDAVASPRFKAALARRVADSKFAVGE